MEVKPGVAPLPGPYLRMLMGGIIVADDVARFFGRRASADQVKEANPFLMTMLVHAGSNAVAVGCIQRSEERGGSIALVVVGQCLAPPWLERKARLSAVPGLNLTLLIARAHNGRLGRVAGEAHEVVEFLLEVLVVGQLETFDPVRLDPRRCPHAANARRADAHLLGLGGSAPVRGSRRLLLQWQADQARPQRSRKRGNASRPGLVFEDAIESAFGLAASPTPHLHLILPQASRDRLILQSVGGQKNDCGTLNQAPRTRPCLRVGFQLSSVLDGQFDGRCNSHARLLTRSY